MLERKNLKSQRSHNPGTVAMSSDVSTYQLTNITPAKEMGLLAVNRGVPVRLTTCQSADPCAEDPKRGPA
jgi:hypothetical protein